MTNDIERLSCDCDAL